MKNEIRKIAKDSGFILPHPDAPIGQDVIISPQWEIQKELDTFSKAIVLECCKMVNVHMQHNNPNDSLLVIDIKERFGIELNDIPDSK